MNWFFIALGAPFLWAFVNISDQYLVSKFSTGERGSGALVLFSSLIGIFTAAMIFIFFADVFSIPNSDKLLLMLVGVITIAYVIFYLFALEIESVSTVVPWFLSVPIFGYVYSYIFLGEILSKPQIIGSIIVLLGLLIISIDFSGEKRKIKGKAVFYMLLACLLSSSTGVIFKYVTIGGDFWISSFWEYVGLGISGIVIFLFIPKYRMEFMSMIRQGGRKIFALNTVSEVLTIVGNLLTNYAILLAPVTLVYLVGSLQPAIVFAFALMGTLFLPHIVKENLSKRVLIPKMVAIVITMLGSVIIFT